MRVKFHFKIPFLWNIETKIALSEGRYFRGTEIIGSEVKPHY